MMDMCMLIEKINKLKSYNGYYLKTSEINHIREDVTLLIYSSNGDFTLHINKEGNIKVLIDCLDLIPYEVIKYFSEFIKGELETN